MAPSRVPQSTRDGGQAVRVRAHLHEPLSGVLGEGGAGPDAPPRRASLERFDLGNRDCWVPDMSGVDWDAVLCGYRPLLDRIRTTGEFTDLLWEVFGELGSSHAYALPPGTVPGRDPGSVSSFTGVLTCGDSGSLDRIGARESARVAESACLAAGDGCAVWQAIGRGVGRCCGAGYRFVRAVPGADPLAALGRFG
jgi:hypothetical protein